jgi:release factor glutamine methyltransferase
MMNGRPAFAGHDATVPTWGGQIAWAEQMLGGAGSPAPRRDALDLLAHLVHAPTAAVLAQPERVLTSAEVAGYAAWVGRRAAGEPAAYITGHEVFMGIDLLADRRVALAGPGTACLVEAALECLRARPAEESEMLVANIGTGGGAVSLALGLFEPRVRHIYAVDESTGALEVARRNGARYLLNVLISWLEGDGLEPVPEPVDLIVANQPDARQAATVAAAGGAVSESRPVLAGDEEGLARMREVIALAPARLRPGGTLLVALDEPQRQALEALLVEALPTAEVWFGPLATGDVRFAAAQVPR